MSKFTPGPWGLTQELERGLRDEVAVCYGAAEGGATYVVAERSALHSSDFRAMRQANARLIAAAPCSHAANVNFIEAMDALYGITPAWGDDRIYDELPSSGIAQAYFMARAAIAKAVGHE